MQFVLVFIDKFITLCKPYVHYEFFDDGVDRGYAVRECCKRIIEISNDREKLREARQESNKLRQRIVGTKGGMSGGAFGEHFKVDEEAFYKNEKRRPQKKIKAPDGYQKSPEKGSGHNEYNPPKERKELTLAEKLGLKEGHEEDKEHVKKRTKEDQKEVEEVKKILAHPGENMANFLGDDIDIFAVEQNESPVQKPNTNTNSNNQPDLFDFTSGPDNQPQTNVSQTNQVNNMDLDGFRFENQNSYGGNNMQNNNMCMAVNQNNNTLINQEMVNQNMNPGMGNQNMNMGTGNQNMNMEMGYGMGNIMNDPFGQISLNTQGADQQNQMNVVQTNNLTDKQKEEKKKEDAFKDLENFL